jgi:hypothetical protein
MLEKLGKVDEDVIGLIRSRFTALDRTGDGKIDQADIDRMEEELAEAEATAQAERAAKHKRATFQRQDGHKNGAHHILGHSFSFGHHHFGHHHHADKAAAAETTDTEVTKSEEATKPPRHKRAHRMSFSFGHANKGAAAKVASEISVTDVVKDTDVVEL